MCGRFTLRSRLNLLLQQFALEGDEDRESLDSRYNIAPTQDVFAVRSRAAGQRELASFRWGLVPSWADDLKIGVRMINARAETIASKPSFAAAFKRRRCLIPGDGFYEWKKTGQAKQPYLMELADGGLFGFAGVALGAFAAHMLRQKSDPYLFEVFNVGIKYHLIHTITLLALALYASIKEIDIKWPGYFFSFGI